jgi:hypothetical protein
MEIERVTRKNKYGDEKNKKEICVCEKKDVPLQAKRIFM